MRFQFKQAVYVLSRMSTAVFMLGIIALASVAGTVFLQNQPTTDYQNTFGLFWSEVFKQMSLHQVYTAPWYLVILGVMLVSVITCLFTNGPRFIKLWRTPRRAPALSLLRQWPMQELITQTEAKKLQRKLIKQGFTCKWDSDAGQYYTCAPWSRAGYFLSHVGVVILAMGGLLTGFMGFRGTLHLPSGASLDAVWVQTTDSGYAREIPFHIRNDGFALETYPDGTAKSFTTQLTLIDGATEVTKNLAVNAPVRHRNHSIYQSSYGDAGSKVSITVLNLNNGKQQPFKTAVHEELPLGEAMLSVDDARMHETRQLELPGSNTITMQDVGPSVDVNITYPHRRPMVLRLYLNHPDMLGVAQSMTSEGAPVFATIPLGLNPTESDGWALFMAVKHHLAQHPNDDLNMAIIKVSPQFVRHLDTAERVTLVAKTLQALSITQNLNLELLPALTQLQPAYYTALQIAYDPGFWWFIIGSIMLIAGVFLMVYADHWRVWFVPQKNKILLAAHTARRQDRLQELWAKNAD